MWQSWREGGGTNRLRSGRNLWGKGEGFRGERNGLRRMYGERDV